MSSTTVSSKPSTKPDTKNDKAKAEPTDNSKKVAKKGSVVVSAKDAKKIKKPVKSEDNANENDKNEKK